MSTSTTEPNTAIVRDSRLDPVTASRLAATAYERYLELVRSLTDADWKQRTECPAWDVRAMAGHNVGMAVFTASPDENQRMVGAAVGRGGVFIDALTGLQVEEHAELSTDELIARYAEVTPQAAAVRQHLPAEARQSVLPLAQHVNGADERWTVGYLFDVILTRDAWMHYVDTCRAIGRDPILTKEHDGVLLDDVVTEWADRHGRPFRLRLTGPAGGSWTRGEDGPQLELDAVEFCRILSGRASGDGLLTTEVPF